MKTLKKLLFVVVLTVTCLSVSIPVFAAKVSMSKEKFNEKKALGKLMYTTHKIGSGVVVIIKNKNKYTVGVTVDSMFYNKSKMVGTTSDFCYALESGRQCALFCPNPTKSNLRPIQYTKYKIKLDVSEAANVVGNATKIKYAAGITGENLILTVKNKGKRAEWTNIAVVFYKKGKIIGYEYHYAYVKQPGSKAYVKYSFPRDSKYKPIVPDKYKIYVNTSYRFNWQ